MNAKETTTCGAGFILQKPTLIHAFAVILAALTLSACEQKTETTEPAVPLATPSPQPTIGQSPTAWPPAPSATSSPDYGEDSGERGVEDQEAVPEFPWPPPKASA